MKVVLGVVIALLAFVAAARADDTPPPAMRDVPIGTDATVAASFGGTFGGVGFTLASLEARGRLRLGGHAELFASVGAGDFERHDDENRGYDRSFVTNTNLGARGVIHASDAVTMSLAGSLWLPTATYGFPNANPDLPNGGFSTKEDADALRGLRDPYAFADGGAAGVSLDVRANVAPTWYVQAEAAAVFARSSGRAQLDDVELAVGAGMTSTHGAQVSAELRIVQQPSGVQATGEQAYAFAVAIGWPEKMPHPRLVMSAALSEVRGALVVGGEMRFP